MQAKLELHTGNDIALLSRSAALGGAHVRDAERRAGAAGRARERADGPHGAVGGVRSGGALVVGCVGVTVVVAVVFDVIGAGDAAAAQRGAARAARSASPERSVRARVASTRTLNSGSDAAPGGASSRGRLMSRAGSARAAALRCASSSGKEACTRRRSVASCATRPRANGVGVGVGWSARATLVRSTPSGAAVILTSRCCRSAEKTGRCSAGYAHRGPFRIMLAGKTEGNDNYRPYQQPQAPISYANSLKRYCSTKNVPALIRFQIYSVTFEINHLFFFLN
ncbi:hypothetical protein FGB62_257g00 [Gracilaria domingensis]|nr:hypothetical protein FGB62_257g00 [Gracilaria domingensis]